MEEDLQTYHLGGVSWQIGSNGPWQIVSSGGLPQVVSNGGLPEVVSNGGPPRAVWRLAMPAPPRLGMPAAESRTGAPRP
jgi:hypothetical protein